MHHLAVKSSLVDSVPEAAKLRFRGNDQPLCPKPRRLGPSVPEFLKPLSCCKHSQQIPDGRSGILNLISDKGIAIDGRVTTATCSGCSASCYSGSPPGRTDNPLVQDVVFIHQMELLSPFTRTKFADKLSFASPSPF